MEQQNLAMKEHEADTKFEKKLLTLCFRALKKNVSANSVKF